MLFAIFFALQVLINSTLAYAHMATNSHDLQEAVHVHAGTDHAEGAREAGLEF